MKTAMIAVLVVSVLLIAGGIVGMSIQRNAYEVVSAEEAAYTYGGGMMYDYYSDSYDEEEYYYHGRGGMYGYYYDEDETANEEATASQEPMDIEELEVLVEEYIADIDDNLVISDIFVFEDSEYYFSIMEEDTGKGAMELLVNQYTGYIYPESGPNMMWNLKYGMHSSSSYMMGGRSRGMYGGYSSQYYYDSDVEENTVTKQEAVALAQEYVDQYIGEEFTVSDEGHEFYGYYTFHLEEDGQTVGMISVNGLTGQVWFHDWHGTVSEVIGGSHGH